MYREESNEIAIRSSVNELINAWDQSVSDLKAGFALIEGAQERLRHFFGDGNHSISIQHYRQSTIDFRRPEDTVKELSKDVWRALTNRLELRKVLSLKRTKELDAQLSSGEGLPDLTLDNVNAMLSSNLANLETFAEEKIHEVYQYLRPERSQLKTNQKSVAAGIGSKVILSWAVELGWSKGFRVNHHRTDNLRAIDQVFHLLDGLSPANDYNGELANALESQTKTTGATFETKYFKGKCCRNSNLHLEFKRADLVRLFNLVAGGMRLTDAKATANV